MLTQEYKYFAGSHNDACLNLATFDGENLVLEIVVCRGVEEQVDDYSLLNTLYSRVEQQANNGMIQQELPVVTSITQSLQQVI